VTLFLARAILSCFKVQERALGVVPGLCESIDYAEVQSVLFPRVAVRFFIYRSHGRLTDDTIARFHENTHSVRESSYSRHFLKYGQNT
jgi:hypothetical protein